MRMYLLLKERAASYRADPEVLEAHRGRRRRSTPRRWARRDARRPAGGPQRLRGLRPRCDRPAAGTASSGCTSSRSSTCSAPADPVPERRDAMTLVAGIDSSTQSCKVVIRDAETGALAREGRAPHPDGTAVDPAAWWDALQRAAAEAGGLDDVAALSVGGPAARHGLPGRGRRRGPRRAAVERHPLGRCRDATWSRSWAGRDAWAAAVGSVPVASFTVTKLRWLADHEPDNARRTAAVCLPHDWLTWRLAGARRHRRARHGPQRRQRHRLLVAGDRAVPARPARARPRPSAVVPRVLGPSEPGRRIGRRDPRPRRRRQRGVGARGRGPAGRRDRLDRHVGGGVRGQRHTDRRPDRDRRRVRVGHRRLPAAGLHHERGAGARRDDRGCWGSTRRACPTSRSRPRAAADGVVLVPYLEGERTPNRPDATGSLHGLTLAHLDARPPGPRRGRGPALRARRRARCACCPRGSGRPRHPDRRRRPVGGGAGARAGRAGPHCLGARAR